MNTRLSLLAAACVLALAACGNDTTPADNATPAATPSDTAPADTTPTDAGAPFISHWPWLLALIAALGAAIWYFRRQKSGYAFAGAGGGASAFDLSSPEPAPPAADGRGDKPTGAAVRKSE